MSVFLEAGYQSRFNHKYNKNSSLNTISAQEYSENASRSSHYSSYDCWSMDDVNLSVPTGKGAAAPCRTARPQLRGTEGAGGMDTKKDRPKPVPLIIY